MSWILLRSGHPFDLLNPTVDMIRPVDIAYALARICRFNSTVPHKHSSNRESGEEAFVHTVRRLRRNRSHSRIERSTARPMGRPGGGS